MYNVYANTHTHTVQLKPGETYKHRLSLVFFYKGTYQIEVRGYASSPREGGRDETDLDYSTVLELESYNSRVSSPILRGSRSPPALGEPLSELCGSGGSIFAPVKIKPQPLKCQLVPAPTTQDAHTSREGLMAIEEVTGLAGTGKEDNTTSTQAGVLEQMPFPLQHTRCRTASNATNNLGSMHKRLLWLCEHYVAGPVVSLHIVESHNPQTYS